MQVKVTSRRIELTPSLRAYAENRLQVIKKYVEKITNVHIILNVEKDRHIADVVLELSKNRIAAQAVAGDMYSAIDMVTDKIAKQVRRHMDKVKAHTGLPYAVVANIVQEQQASSASTDVTTLVKEIKEFEIRKQSIANALKELQERDLNFWLFKNSKDSKVSVVYRRSDKTFGMLIVN
ncbi:MAG: ribosome-associated translation inhibitor RaiA [Elusimicrobia bacterium]|nr:ribosome-associated translation inhibitor RaiA [Elusimicrobiota bacterium]